ncbi:PAS domain S-box protein [Reyranella sp.]|uniref:PAS domain S-box protein n=1 Tax=Reyranella sp. TaxID=1929291 RepID=UPI00121D2E17|nr:PAS domain S-box protein [Reyranella sp.]TAJ85392.1 MAG: PAS domain S-box protein [Reyranella sp.]
MKRTSEVREASPDSSLSFLASGGEMGALMRAHDWTTSPLGDPGTWPQSLRSVVQLMLNNRQLMFVAWGKELAFLYNDGYVPTFGSKHPRALGRPFSEVWSEIWDDIEPLVSRALAGETTYNENLHLVMERNGYPEDAWFTFSYSPVRDESGAIEGMFCAGIETTGQVLAERRLIESEARSRALMNASSDVVYRMSADWTEMRRLDGRGFVADTDQPSVKWIDEYVFSDDRPHVRAVIDEALRTKGVFELEHRVRRVDGTAAWTFSRAVPVLGADGEIVEWFGMASDATERVNAEVALRESEARYRRLFDTIDEGFCVIEFIDGPHGSLSDYVHVEANPAYTANAGIPDIVGKRLREIVTDEADAWAEIYRRVLLTGEPVRFERELVATGRHLELAAFRVEPSERRQVAVIFKDVTARRAAEAALRESEARFRNMADHAPVMMWVTDPSGYCTYLNARWYEFTGQTQKEAEGFGWLDATHPDDKAEAERVFLEANAARRPFRHEYRLRRADGAYRWAIDAATPRVGANGVYLGYVGSVIDIDERREAEDALRASEGRLRELNDTLESQVTARTAERDRMWDTSPDLMLVIEFDGVLRRVNPAWTTTLGYMPDELVGHHVNEFVIPDDHDKTVQAYELAGAAGRPAIEIRYRHKDGSIRWISWVAAPAGDVTYATGRDITADKARQAELTQAQEALRQSQKMEAMGSLTGGVAHDFNNLLTPIVGALDMLQRRSLGGEREQRLIAGATQSAERAKVLVQRLLAFARRQPLQPVAVDVARLVREMADLVATTTGPQIKVVVEADDGLPPAKADPNQLEMALLNLVVNARDAMPDGGTLRISVSANKLRDGAASWLEPAEYVRVSVADTGIGMDESTLARAVEPFFSTKGVGKGTGLGLSMVHGLASQLGGALTIKSNPGLGTNIELWLPQTKAAPEAPAITQDAELPPGRGTALLVDDEELVRLSTADMLSDLGYRVIEAASADEALSVIGNGAHVDLVVTDHLMPGMTGTDLARAVHCHRPELPVLIVSAYAEVEGVAPDLPRLTKPFRKEELAVSIAGLFSANRSNRGVAGCSP